MVRQADQSSKAASASLRSVGAFGDSFTCSQYGASDLDLDADGLEAVAQEAEVAARARLSTSARERLRGGATPGPGDSTLAMLLESGGEDSLDGPSEGGARDASDAARSRGETGERGPARNVERKGRRGNAGGGSGVRSNGGGAGRGLARTLSSKFDKIHAVCEKGPGKETAPPSPAGPPPGPAAAPPAPPPLVCFTLTPRPTDAALGLRLRQTPDGAIRVASVAPGSPASRTPLRPGHELLSVRGHRLRDAERCVKALVHYHQRGTAVEVVASAGPRPRGAAYVMVKWEGAGGPPRGAASVGVAPAAGPREGFHGLVLDERGGRVRVVGFGAAGLFLGSRIAAGDVLLSFDGRPVRSIEDCHLALGKVTRLLIPVLVYKAAD